jgi:dTDP-glucose pyrophosphorylase
MSRVIYGCMGLGRWDGQTPDAADHAATEGAIAAALDIGITTFDHADIYGHGSAETVFGDLLDRNAGLRARVQIQTKCGIRLAGPGGPGIYDLRPETIRTRVHESLERLRTEYVDSLLLHRPDPLTDPAEIGATLTSLYDEGLVLAVGVSNMSAAQITALQAHTSVPITANQLEMSLLRRDWLEAIVLAGGEGKRLMPLTADRAKPAVPFAGIYRLIDFALSNVVNSGYLKVVVLTQYKSHSLDRHVTQTWRMSTMLGNYVTPVPAQQRVGKHWYLGSADAIYQSLNLMNDERPDIVVVVGADHVYRMDFSQMVDQHIDSGAACTVAGDPAADLAGRPVRRDRRAPDDPTRIREFLEKPKDPPGLPDSPDEVLASMGNYVFDADALVEAVTRDATT